VADGVPVRLEDYANKPWYKRMLYGAAYVFYRTVLRAIASGRYDE
jgi:cardiolipin synthase